MNNKSDISRICVGVIFLIIGFGYIGNLFHIWHFSIFFSGWWTFLIILPSFSSIYEKGFNILNSTWLLFGLSLLLGELDLIHAQDVIRLGVPLILIALGFYLVTKRND